MVLGRSEDCLSGREALLDAVRRPRGRTRRQVILSRRRDARVAMPIGTRWCDDVVLLYCRRAYVGQGHNHPAFVVQMVYDKRWYDHY
jgi:hypothetical protein